MELQNFQPDSDGISLNWQGQNLDLHNCFDFQSLYYSIALRQLEATWLRSTEEWAKNTVLPGFTIRFSVVSFFRVKERDKAYPFTEDNCLAHISFHPTELRDEYDDISLSNLATDDLTFYFQSEWGFKVNAAAVQLIPLPIAASR